MGRNAINTLEKEKCRKKEPPAHLEKWTKAKQNYINYYKGKLL